MNIPAEYVKKISEKIKRQTKHDVGFWVANSIMGNLIMGYEQRNHYLKHCLDTLEGTEVVYLSVCCRVPTDITDKEGKVLTGICAKCGQLSRLFAAPRKEIIQLIHQTIDLLRKEDEALVGFADKMGFTNKEPPVNQNILMIGGDRGDDNKQKRKTVECTMEMQNDLEKLTPREREQTRKKIEQYFLEGLDDDGDIQTTDEKT